MKGRHRQTIKPYPSSSSWPRPFLWIKLWSVGTNYGVHASVHVIYVTETLINFYLRRFDVQLKQGIVFTEAETNRVKARSITRKATVYLSVHVSLPRYRWVFGSFSVDLSYMFLRTQWWAKMGRLECHKAMMIATSYVKSERWNVHGLMHVCSLQREG